MGHIGLRRLLSRRTLALVVLTAVAVSALSAKCIENTKVFVDSDGYTHIVGEMFNETEIQGTAIVLRGRLLDANGNVIAEKDTPICPPDSQPRAQSVFDIRFDNPNLPPHASFTVNAVAGKVLDAPLPNPNILVLDTDAIKLINVPPIPGFPLQDGDVAFFFGVRNRSQTVYHGIQACAAAYNNQGKVVAVSTGEVIEFDEEGNIGPATLDFRSRVNFFIPMTDVDVPLEAAYVRGWLWIGNPGDPTSQYQFVMTPPITLQTVDFFN
jgi:hypothetical protein